MWVPAPHDSGATDSVTVTIKEPTIWEYVDFGSCQASVFIVELT